MDLLKKDELTQLFSQMNIEVNNEWSNVLELHQELQKLLNSCNTEARHSWAIIDKVRRSASTVTLELSDLEKELSNDITLSTNYRFTSDVDSSHSHPKSDLKYVKTSSCHTSLLSLFHPPLPESDTLSNNPDGLAEADLRQMRLQFHQEGNLEQSKSSNGPHKNFKESFVEDGKRREVKTKNLDGILTNDSIWLSDESKNSCQKSTAISIIKDDILKCENEYIQQLRQQYLEKRDNDTIIDKNRLFYKMANNYKPIGFNSLGIESSQTNSNNVESDSTNIVHLYKEHTLYKVCVPQEVISPPETNQIYLRNCKSLNDLYTSSDEIFEESTTIINVERIKENRNYECPKWFEIPKCASEICVQSARCYFHGRSSKMGKVSSAIKSKLKKSEAKCCIRCKKSIQDINHVKWDSDTEVRYIEDKEKNLFNSFAPFSYVQKNCFRCKKAMTDIQSPFPVCQLSEKKVAVEKMFMTEEKYIESEQCDSSFNNQPMPPEPPKKQDQCCFVGECILGNNIDKELKDQFCQTDTICDVCQEKKQCIYPMANNDQPEITKNSVACQNNEILQLPYSQLCTAASGIINDLKTLSASKLCRPPTELIRIKAFPIPFEKDVKSNSEPFERAELCVSVLNASTDKYNLKTPGLRKNVTSSDKLVPDGGKNKKNEGETKEANSTKSSGKIKPACTDGTTLYNPYLDKDKLNIQCAMSKQDIKISQCCTNNNIPVVHERPTTTCNNRGCCQQSPCGKVPNVLTVDMDKITGLGTFTSSNYSIRYDDDKEEEEENTYLSTIRCSFESEPIQEQTGPEICCDNVQTVRNIEDYKYKTNVEECEKPLGEKAIDKTKKSKKTKKNLQNVQNVKSSANTGKSKTQKYSNVTSKENACPTGGDIKRDVTELPLESRNEIRVIDACNCPFRTNVVPPVKYDMESTCKEKTNAKIVQTTPFIPEQKATYNECPCNKEILDTTETKQFYFENPDESLLHLNENMQCVEIQKDITCPTYYPSPCGTITMAGNENVPEIKTNVSKASKKRKIAKKTGNANGNKYLNTNLNVEMENEQQIAKIENIYEESVGTEKQTDFNTKCNCMRTFKSTGNRYDEERNICDLIGDVNSTCDVKDICSLGGNSGKMEKNGLNVTEQNSFDRRNENELTNPLDCENDKQATSEYENNKGNFHENNKGIRNVTNKLNESFNQVNNNDRIQFFNKGNDKLNESFLSKPSCRSLLINQNNTCRSTGYNSYQISDDKCKEEYLRPPCNIENLCNFPTSKKCTIGGQFGASDYLNKCRVQKKIQSVIKPKLSIDEEFKKCANMRNCMQFRLNSVSKSVQPRNKKCGCKQKRNSSNGSDSKKLAYRYCKCKKAPKCEKINQICKGLPMNEIFLKPNVNKKVFCTKIYRDNKDMNVYTTTCLTDNSAIQRLQNFVENSQNTNSDNGIIEQINDQNDSLVDSEDMKRLNKQYNDSSSTSESFECSKKIVKRVVHISKYGSKIKSNVTSKLTKNKGQSFMKNIKHVKTRRKTVLETDTPTQAIELNKTQLVKRKSLIKSHSIANLGNKLWQQSHTIEKDTLSYVALTPFQPNRNGKCVNSKSSICLTSFCNFSSNQQPMWRMGCLPANPSQLSMYKKNTCPLPPVMCMPPKTPCCCQCNKNQTKCAVTNYADQIKPYNFAKEGDCGKAQKGQFGNNAGVSGDKSQQCIVKPECDDQVIQPLTKQKGLYKSKPRGKFSPQNSSRSPVICLDKTESQRSLQQAANQMCNFNQMCPNRQDCNDQNLPTDCSGQQMLMNDCGEVIPYSKECEAPVSKQNKKKNVSSCVKDISTPMPVNSIETRRKKPNNLITKVRACPTKPPGCYNSCPLNPKCVRPNSFYKKQTNTVCLPLSNLFKRFSCSSPQPNKTMCPFYPTTVRQLMVASGQCDRISQNCLNSLKSNTNKFFGNSNYRNKICNTATIVNDKNNTVNSANICNVLALCENVFANSERRLKSINSKPKVGIYKKRDQSPLSRSSKESTPLRMFSKIVRKTKTQLCQTEISIPMEVQSASNPFEFLQCNNVNDENKNQNDVKLNDIDLPQLKSKEFLELPKNNSTDIQMNGSPDYNFKISLQIQKQSNNNIGDDETKIIDNKLKGVIESIENKIGLNRSEKLKVEEEKLFLNCKQLNIRKNISTFCSQTDDYKLTESDTNLKKSRKHKSRRKSSASEKVKKNLTEKASKPNKGIDSVIPSFTQNERTYKFSENFFVMPCRYSNVKNNKQQECDFNPSSFQLKTQIKDELSDISEEMSKVSLDCNSLAEKTNNTVNKTPSKNLAKEVQTDHCFSSADSNLSKSSTCAQTDICECFAKDAFELLDIITASLTKQNKLVSTKNNKTTISNSSISGSSCLGSTSSPSSSLDESTSQPKSKHLNTNDNSTEESQQNQQSLTFNCTFDKNHPENIKSKSFFMSDEHKCELAVQTSLTEQPVSVVSSTVTIFNSPIARGNHFALYTTQCTAEESSKPIVTQEEVTIQKPETTVQQDTDSLKSAIPDHSRKPLKTASVDEPVSIVSETNFAAWTLPDLRSIKNDLPARSISRNVEHENRSCFVPSKNKTIEVSPRNVVSLRADRHNPSSFAKWSLPDHRTFSSQSAFNIPIIDFDASEKLVTHTSKSCPHYHADLSANEKENSRDEDENEISEELSSEHEKTICDNILPECESKVTQGTSTENKIIFEENNFHLMPLLVENCSPSLKYGHDSSQTDSLDQNENSSGMKNCNPLRSELKTISCGCHHFKPKESLYCQSEQNAGSDSENYVHVNHAVRSKPKTGDVRLDDMYKPKHFETSKEDPFKERKRKKKMLIDTIYHTVDRNVYRRGNDEIIEKQNDYLTNARNPRPAPLKAKRKNKHLYYPDLNLFSKDQIEKMIYIQQLAFNEQLSNTCIPSYVSKKNHKQWIRYQAKNSPTKAAIIKQDKNVLAHKKKYQDESLALQWMQEKCDKKKDCKRASLSLEPKSFVKFEKEEDFSHALVRKQNFSLDSIQCCVEIKGNPTFSELPDKSLISQVPFQSHISTQYEPLALKEKQTKDVSTCISKEQMKKTSSKPHIKKTSSMNLYKTKMRRAQSDITHSTHHSSHHSQHSSLKCTVNKKIDTGNDTETSKIIEDRKPSLTAKCRTKSVEHLGKKHKVAHSNLVLSNIDKNSYKVLERVKDGHVLTSNKNDELVKSSKMIQTTSDFFSKDINKTITNKKNTGEVSLQTDTVWQENYQKKKDQEENTKCCSYQKNKTHTSKNDVLNQQDKALDIKKNKPTGESKSSSDSCPANFYNPSPYLEEIKKRLDSLKWLESNPAGLEKDPTKAMMDFLFNLISPPLPQKGLKKKESLNAKCQENANVNTSKDVKNAEPQQIKDSKLALNSAKLSKLKLNSGPSNRDKSSCRLKDTCYKTNTNANSKLQFLPKKSDESSLKLKLHRKSLNFEKKSTTSCDNKGKSIINSDKSNIHIIKHKDHKTSKLSQLSKCKFKNNQTPDFSNLKTSANNILKIISVLPEDGKGLNSNNVEGLEKGSVDHDKSGHLFAAQNKEVRLLSRKIVNRGVSTYNGLPEKEEILGAIDSSPTENILKTKIFNPILGRYTEIYRTVQVDSNKMKQSAPPHWIYDITDNTIKLVKNEFPNKTRSHSLPHVSEHLSDHKRSRRSSSYSHQLDTKEKFKNFKIINISKDAITSEKMAQLNNTSCETKSNRKHNDPNIQNLPYTIHKIGSKKAEIKKIDSFTCIEENTPHGIRRKYILGSGNPKEVEEENKSFYRNHNSIARMAEPDFNFRDGYEKEELCKIDGGLAVWRMETTYEKLNEKSENIFDKIAHNCCDKTQKCLGVSSQSYDRKSANFETIVHDYNTQECIEDSNGRSINVHIQNLMNQNYDNIVVHNCCLRTEDDRENVDSSIYDNVYHDLSHNSKKSENISDQIVHDSNEIIHECTEKSDSTFSKRTDHESQRSNKKSENVFKTIVRDSRIISQECTELTGSNSDTRVNHDRTRTSNNKSVNIYEQIVRENHNGNQECTDDTNSTSGKSLNCDQTESFNKKSVNIYNQIVHENFNANQERTEDTNSTSGKSLNCDQTESFNKKSVNIYNQIVHENFNANQERTEDTNSISGKSLNCDQSQSYNKKSDTIYEKIVDTSFNKTQELDDTDSTSGKSMNHAQSQSYNKKSENIYEKILQENFKKIGNMTEDTDSISGESVNQGHSQSDNKKRGNNYEKSVRENFKNTRKCTDDTDSISEKSVNQDQSQSYNKKSENIYEKIVHENFKRTGKCEEDKDSISRKILNQEKSQCCNIKNEIIYQKLIHENFNKSRKHTRDTESISGKSINQEQSQSYKESDHIYDKIVHENLKRTGKYTEDTDSTSGKSIDQDQSQCCNKKCGNIYQNVVNENFSKSRKHSRDTDSTSGKSIDQIQSQCCNKKCGNIYQNVVNENFSKSRKHSRDTDSISGKSINQEQSQSYKESEYIFEKIVHENINSTVKCTHDADSISGKRVIQDQSQSLNKKSKNIYKNIVHENVNKSRKRTEDTESISGKSINQEQSQSYKESENINENIVHKNRNRTGKRTDCTDSISGKSINQDQSQSNKKTDTVYHIVHENVIKLQKCNEESYSDSHKTVNCEQTQSYNKKSENIFDKIYSNCNRNQECTRATNSSSQKSENYNKPQCIGDDDLTCLKNENSNKASANTTENYSEQGTYEKSPTVTCEMNFRTTSSSNDNDLLVIKPAEKWQMTPSMECVMKNSNQGPFQDMNTNRKKKNHKQVLNITNQNNLLTKPKVFKKYTDKKADKSKKNILTNMTSKSKKHTCKSMTQKNQLITVNKELTKLKTKEKSDEKEKYCLSVPSYSNCPNVFRTVNGANLKGDYFSKSKGLDQFFTKVLEVGCSPIDRKSQIRPILAHYLKALNKLSYKINKHLRSMKLALEQENQLEIIKEFSEQRPKERKYFNKEKNSKKMYILFNIHKELYDVKFKINHVYAHFLRFKTCLFHIFKKRDEQENILKLVEIELSKLRSIEKQIAYFVQDIKNQFNQQNHHVPYLAICDKNDKCSKDEMLVKAKLEKLAKTKTRLSEKLRKINTLIVTQLGNQSSPEMKKTSEIILKQKLEHIGTALKTELANINKVLKEDKGNSKNHTTN